MVSNGKLMAFINALGGGTPAPSDIVILPETELTPKETNGVVVGFMGTTTLTAYPEVGKTYTVTINGTQHNLVADSEDGVNGFIAPDETWAVLVVQPEYVEQFGCTVAVEWYSEDVPDSLTLSIVEAAKTESAGGGVLVINVTCDADDEMKTFTNATKDKTYAEAKAVYDAGGIVNARLEYKSGPMLGAKIEFPLKTYTSFDEMAAFIFGIPDGLGANTINIVNDDSLVVMID